MRSARFVSEAPRGASMPNRYTLKAELTAGGVAAFERHFEATRAAFRRTENPSLLQQCDGLLQEAVRHAIRPSWAEPSAEDELDGTTTLEPVPTRTPPKPYTAEG